MFDSSLSIMAGCGGGCMRANDAGCRHVATRLIELDGFLNSRNRTLDGSLSRQSVD